MKRRTGDRQLLDFLQQPDIYSTIHALLTRLVSASSAAAVPLPLLHDGASRSLWHAASAPSSAATDDDEPDASDAPDASALGQVSSNGHVVMKST